MAFIAVAYLVTDDYTPANILLLNAILGPEAVTTQWHFWFIEILVYLLVAMTALLALPWADRAERRFPLLFPLALTGAGLLTRYELVNPGVPHTAPALWLFALGWAVARTRTAAQRCVVSAIAALTIPEFFDNANREYTLLIGIMLLIWLPSIPVPKGLRRLTVVLASASLYAYLVHWLVYPPLAGISPALAVAASLPAGAAYWALCMRVVSAATRRRSRSKTSVKRLVPQPNFSEELSPIRRSTPAGDSEVLAKVNDFGSGLAHGGHGEPNFGRGHFERPSSCLAAGGGEARDGAFRNQFASNSARAAKFPKPASRERCWCR